jgi:Cdc6-like AAA superfamily ATPase
MKQSDRIIGRQSQLSELQKIVAIAPAIFVTGIPSTGKTIVLNDIFSSYSSSNVACINAIECITPHMIFQRAVNTWSGVKPSVENDFYGYSACQDLAVFVQAVTKLCANEKDTRYLVR